VVCGSPDRCELAAQLHRGRAAEGIGKAAQHPQHPWNDVGRAGFVVGKGDLSANHRGLRAREHHLATSLDQSVALQVVIGKAAANDGAKAATDLCANVNGHYFTSATSTVIV